MPDTALHLHLLHPFDVISEVGGEIGTGPVEVFAGCTVETAVEHPDWDAVLSWVLDDRDDLLFLGWSEGAGAAEWVETSAAGDGMGEAAANTGDRAESEVERLAAVDVGREHTDHVAEGRRISHLERHELKGRAKPSEKRLFVTSPLVSLLTSHHGR